jgi:hypothetical protein
MVSTAINFICESMGSKFSTMKGEFAVFHAAFVVNTGLEEAIVKHKIHLYYIQPTAFKDESKVLNDICYWQQQYTKLSSMRQSNRKQKASNEANTKNHASNQGM